MSDDKLLEQIKSGSFGFAEDFAAVDSNIATVAEEDFDETVWLQRQDEIPMMEFLAFEVMSTVYAIPLLDIHNVIGFPRVTIYPAKRDYVLGGFQYSNQIYPLVDLEKLIRRVSNSEDKTHLGGSDIRKQKVCIVQFEERLVGFTIPRIRRAYRWEVERLVAVPDEVHPNVRDLYSAVIQVEDEVVYTLSVAGIFKQLD